MTYIGFSGVEHTKATERVSHYNIPQDGFMFLAMGFISKPAAQMKEAFIGAFNAMADAANSGRIAASGSVLMMIKKDES